VRRLQTEPVLSFAGFINIANCGKSFRIASLILRVDSRILVVHGAIADCALEVCIRLRNMTRWSITSALLLDVFVEFIERPWVSPSAIRSLVDQSMSLWYRLFLNMRGENMIF
jgi:hypothetical protein